MLRAAVVSPFYEEAQGMPWITWTRQEPVTGLPDSTAEMKPAPLEDPPYEPAAPVNLAVSATPYTPPHQRYSAVIDKMKQASRKIGTYADWHT